MSVVFEAEVLMAMQFLLMLRSWCGHVNEESGWGRTLL